MAEKKKVYEPTVNQAKAIEHDGHNILVSASAGSGKTTVLINRIIGKVLAAKNPLSVDQLLIVTFTDAAALEMAERLEKALVKALEEAPEDSQRHQDLKLQLELLPAADISTIHSFALHLIESYYHVIDLDPQFRLLGDEIETTMMKSDVLDQVFEDLYTEALHPETISNQKKVQDFPYLVELFSNDRSDEGLREVVLQLFNFANARPDFDAWLESQATNYNDWKTPFKASKLYQNGLQAKMLADISKIQEQATLAVDALQDYAGTGDALGQIAESATDLVTTKSASKEEKEAQELTIRYQQLKKEKDIIDIIAQGLAFKSEMTLSDLRITANQLTWPAVAGKLVLVKSDDARDAMNAAKDLREKVKARMIDFKNNYLLLDDESYATVTEAVFHAVNDLVAVVQRFNIAFSAYKRQKKVLDFNDLEHFALKIMQDETTAATVQSRYSEIMIDEYQDVNPLQETLLTSLSNQHNMFMVGDIKQSIYGFRLADPDLFGHKYKEVYQPWLENTAEPDKELVILPENFRSHEQVTTFINMIFSQIMNEALGDVNYDGSSRLLPKAESKPHDLTPEIEMLVYINETSDTDKKTSVSEVSSLNESFDENDDGDTPLDDKATGQIKVVATKIKKLMAELGPQPNDTPEQLSTRLRLQDIAILEPTRNLNLKLIDVFKEAGIPIVINDAGNYFQSVEVNVMMSLLQIIDNPNQDIPLVAVLRSPIVGLDENELAFIRAHEKKGNYYVALTKFMQAYADENQIITDLNGIKINDKLVAFFTLFENWRRLATQNQLVELIWRIYEDTGYLEYVGGMPAGAQRQANLHALYERAEIFAQSSYIGLFSFIKYIEQLRKKNKDLDSAVIETNDDAVRVMTIHASKGQEFPVVFLLDTTHQFRTQDLSKNMIIDNQCGLTIPYLDQKHRLQVELPRRAFVQEAYKKRLWSESLRVFYVALTRAKKRLYLVGAYRDTASMLKGWHLNADNKSLFIPTDTRLAAKSFMDWVGLAISRHPSFYNPDKNGFYSELGDMFTDLKATTVAMQKQLGPADLALFKSDFVIQKCTPDNLSGNFNEDETSVVEDIVADDLSTSDIDKPVAEFDITELVSTKFDHYKDILKFKYPHALATSTTAYQSVSEIKRLFEDPDNLSTAQISLTPTGFAKETGIQRHITDDFAVPVFTQVNDDRPSKTAIGSATHLLLQVLPLQPEITINDIQICLDNLVVQQAVDANVASMVDIASVAKLFTTSLGKMLINPTNKVYREQPFSMLIPANKLYHEFSGGDERVLIHGIMDGYIITENGEITLFDYKTDHIITNQKAMLLERYAGQLNLYAEALIKIKQLSAEQPVKKVIFSLALGCEIEVNNHLDL